MEQRRGVGFVTLTAAAYASGLPVQREGLIWPPDLGNDDRRSGRRAVIADRSCVLQRFVVGDG